MNSVGSSPGMNRLPRTRQPGGWLSVRSRPQLLTLTWCISYGVLPRNVSPIHAPGDPAVSMPRMTMGADAEPDRKSTRLNSSHLVISYAVFCLKKKKGHDRVAVHDTLTTPAARR